MYMSGRLLTAAAGFLCELGLIGLEVVESFSGILVSQALEDLLDGFLDELLTVIARNVDICQSGFVDDVEKFFL